MSAKNGYYRHPAIHGDLVAFVSEDDLWSVPATGGFARRLTANPGTVGFPAFSSDGKWIAFTGRDDGPAEVYVMEADGGPPRRLTFLGAFSQVAGWSRDGRSVIFGSDWRRPFAKWISLHTVPLEGGAPSPIEIGPARAISFQPGGAGLVIGRDSGDPARWKRYRGGTAGTLWIDRAGEGRFAPLLTLKGNLASPMWIGSRIYFLSDHDGVGNLYSCSPNGRGLTRHTHHQDFYVRYPSTDGSRIVFHAGADLFLFDPATGEERTIDLGLAGSQSQRNRKFVPAARFLESFDLHPQGHSMASVHRGGLYSMGLWEGAPLRHGLTTGTRYRLGAWLPDGRRLAAMSDETGEEELVILPVENPVLPENGGPEPASGRRPARKAASKGRGSAADPVPKRVSGDFGRAVSLLPAPAGRDRIALTNQRQELLLVDVPTGRVRVIERSPFARIAGVAWSADGRWLAYGFPSSRRTCAIHLCDVETGKVAQITRPDFYDVQPAFDPEGKYLYFISFRIFDPVYDNLYFDLGFPKGSKPFLVTLRKDVVSPFAAANRAPRAPGAFEGKPNGAGREAEKKSESPPAKVEIDLDGIEERVVAFPVAEGVYGRIAGAKNRALFSSFPVEGSLEANWASMGEPPAKGSLLGYNLEDDRTDTVSDRITDFTLSMDAKVLGIRSGNRVRVVSATWKSEGKPVKDEPGRESGWCDLDRLRVSVVPGDEWRQMFREAWRLQRDQFWVADMSGLDWKGVHDRYLRLVDRVASRAEFSDLLWEMQGELGTSHCYELGGDYRPEPAWYQGFLGADLAFDRRTGAWTVARIPRGDSWDERRSSPLAAPGINVRPGDQILEAAGQPVDRSASPYERLVHYAGREVVLKVRSGAKGNVAARVVAVKALREETSLRYRDWVETNRDQVHKASKGRVGYVHVPNMGPLGYSEFHRYYLSEVYNDGLIIDVRFNGGGHVSQLLLEKLVRRRVGYDANRWGTPEPYPIDSPAGPMVALTNEYAGSDGDIFSHTFKMFGLGPLIGKRTWGGVVGIWPRHSLVDGTVTTQPEFAFWFADVGWGVENYGTDPDIEVEFRPQDYAAGRDPQLERALAEVEKLIRKARPLVPDMKNRPRLGPVRLQGAPTLSGAAAPARKAGKTRRRNR